jgi:very-short-patch-repair endonuclease
MKALARTLRRNQTDAERRLWSRIRNRQLSGFKFRRQFPIPPYIVDFLCVEARLIIELDGSQHQTSEEYDGKRSRILRQRGYRIIRFWDNDVLLDTDAVLEAILEILTAPLPSPLPASGARG